MARGRKHSSSRQCLPSQKLLLVEGSDDQNVIESLLRAGGLDIQFEVRQKGGIDGVINKLRGVWQTYGMQAIGIVVDADDDLHRQWGNLSRALGSDPVFRNLPAEPEIAGTVIRGIPRLGIWVMPDNRNSGELEDFIFRMIPESDPIWPRSEQYIDEIPEWDRKFPIHKTLRAKVHSWMATRSRPRPMWSGISENDLVLEDNSHAFLAWLRKLFIEAY